VADLGITKADSRRNAHVAGIRRANIFLCCDQTKNPSAGFQRKAGDGSPAGGGLF